MYVDKQAGKSSLLEKLIKAILANKALTLQLAERDAEIQRTIEMGKRNTLIMQDEIQTLKQRLSDYEECKGVEEYYAILCKSREQQQEIQRLRGLYERERDIADEAQNEMERLRTVLTQIEDESSREDGCLTQINGMAQDALSHQTEQPDTRCTICEGERQTVRYGRKELGEPHMVISDCYRCTQPAPKGEDSIG